MVRLVVESPRKPDYLVDRRLLENTRNIKDTKWLTFCKERDEQRVRSELARAGIQIVQETK